ncbi:MAG: DNA polymerase III subunit beta [Chloroflexi bacterium]|nr:DNA polymerase III subunit beta [Chloroflexota bacterium]MCZ6707587.1 DNA polymerase III subunit beta [Chloroflexota bacterium]
MKLTTQQEDLQRGLNTVGRAVATRSTLPQTSHIYLATDGGRLKLAATNLEIAITAWVSAAVEDEGAITIPARLLTEFIASLPTVEVALTVAPRSKQVQIVAARNDATISGMDAEDFPPIPTIDSGETIRLEPAALREAIEHTVLVAATDESRPVLTGVDLKIEEGQITMAASDGLRLAVYTMDIAEAPSDVLEIIVPGRALVELGRLLADQEEPVTLQVNSTRSQVLFRLSDVELTAQLIQGTFPSYTQLIPSEYQTRATVDAAEFLREVRTAAVFARDGSGIVRLVMSPGNGEPGKLTLSARAEEQGEHQGEMDASVDGEEARIAFNSRYLQDVLQVLGGGQLALESTGPSNPGVFRPVGREDYVHVIMPMFVQW